MTIKEKQEIISAVTTILEIILKVDESRSTSPIIQKEEKEFAPTEMMTIKECAKLIPGLAEHAVRVLVKQNKIKHINCGRKTLINKVSFLNYLEGIDKK